MTRKEEARDLCRESHMFTDEDGCPREQDPDACEQCAFIAYLIERTEKRCAAVAERWSPKESWSATWLELFRPIELIGQ